MTRDDAKLQRELAEINARFKRHERITHWVLGLVVILVVLALVVSTHLLLRAEGAL